MKTFGEKYFEITPRGQAIDPRKWRWRPKHLGWFKNPKQFHVKKEFEVFLPQKLGRGFTLVISPKDVQTGALLKTLREKKKPYVFIFWDHFALKGNLHFDLKRGHYFLRFQNTIVDLSKARSVYFSNPDLVESQFDTSNYFSFSEKLFINRWSEALLNLEGILKAKWFPAVPSKLMSLSQKKMAELKLAKSLGFAVPATIYSTSPEGAHHFMHEYDRVVLREYGRRVFVDRKNNFKQLGIKVIDPHDRDLGLIENSPCVFQEYIEKDFEVRAVVVGNKILACKILSRKNKKAALDWRGQEGDTPFVRFKLPTKIEKQLVRFARAKGFAFASFDLIKSLDGKFYFLEMNRPGNWFFIEALTGIPIRSTLVKLM